MAVGDKTQDFFEKVYAIVREIPYGKVTTYGHIARYLSSPKSARVVGWAMNASHHVTPYVPAHRVVNRIGVLTGKHHFQSQNMMQELLEQEGIAVKNLQIVDFEKHLWNPFV